MKTTVSAKRPRNEFARALSSKIFSHKVVPNKKKNAKNTHSE